MTHREALDDQEDTCNLACQECECYLERSPTGRLSCPKGHGEWTYEPWTLDQPYRSWFTD